jgi:mannosylfructose-phosphate synthase
MPKIKRICMLSTHGYFDPEPILGATDTGGQVTYVLELSKHLAQLGCKVDIYTRRFADRSEVDPVNEEVRVIRIPSGPNEFIRKEDLFPHLDELADNMLAFMDKNGLRYEVYHSHYWDAGYVSMRLTEKLGTHYFYTAHSLGAWKKEQMGGDPEEMEKLFKFSERIHWENIIFRKARAQTVTTIDGKQNYKRLYGFESPSLVIIPPGVDTKRFRPLLPGERDRTLDVPGRYIFALSRIDSNKGHDSLIRAFEGVARQCEAVLLIGGGSKNPKQHEMDVKARLEKLVAELDLGDRVKFTGYIPDDDLATYYRKAAVFVLPSKYEPFGMTTLEAMSCGTPVIATRFGGIKDDLEHGVDSLLVDPTDPKEFSKAMFDVLTDEKLASKLSENGRKTIDRTFSWESIAARTIKFYEQFGGTGAS